MTGIRLDLRWLPSESTPLMGVFSALTITPAAVHTLRLVSLFVSQAPDHWTTGHANCHLCAHTLEMKADCFRKVVFVFGDIGKRPVIF
jgi:hypothetical protein